MTTKIFKSALLASALSLGCIYPAWAHFQMIIPSQDMVTDPKDRSLQLQLMFWHPFEGHGMGMTRPARFGVRLGGSNSDLLDSLQPQNYADINGEQHAGFRAVYAVKKPGDHIFYVEPQPYWEPAEESFIVHYTKVVVNAFGLEGGWDKELGLKTEIIPLTRPYGLYAGNVFQGIVKVNGKPAPYTEVEVEYYNKDGKLTAPADPMITQVVKADANGVFTYAMPKAGWWAFAALNEDENTMSRDGKEYPVEIGAVLCVHTHPMK